MRTRIVLLGPPASGKGTQAEMIEKCYHLPITSPGAILREERNAGTARGIEAERLTSKGLLLPDSLIVGLVNDWLQRQNSSFIFDGFPRSVGQAEAIEEILHHRGTPIDAVIALEADNVTLQNRVTRRVVCSRCGRSFSIGFHVADQADQCPICHGVLTRRSDDTLEALAVRLKEYHEKTEPLIGYYEKKSLLYRVDSTREPGVVFGSIQTILEG